MKKQATAQTKTQPQQTKTQPQQPKNGQPQNGNAGQKPQNGNSNGWQEVARVFHQSPNGEGYKTLAVYVYDGGVILTISEKKTGEETTKVSFPLSRQSLAYLGAELTLLFQRGKGK